LKPSKNSSNSPFRLTVALICLAAAISSSCAPLRPKPDTVSLPPAETLVDELRQKQDRLQSFAGRGRLRFKDPWSHYSFDVNVAAIRPDRLRLQAFDLMGRPVMILTANHEELSLLDYRQAILYRGEATPENLSRFLPLNLRIEDVITLLAGQKPLGPFVRAEVKLDRDFSGDYWRLELTRPGEQLVDLIWMVPHSLKISRSEIGPPRQEPWFRLEFSDYQDLAGQSAPLHIFWADLKNKAETAVVYEEFRIDPDLPATLFSLPSPPGIKVAPFPEHAGGS